MGVVDEVEGLGVVDEVEGEGVVDDVEGLGVVDEVEGVVHDVEGEQLGVGIREYSSRGQ